MRPRTLLAWGLPALGLVIITYYVLELGPERLVGAFRTMGAWIAVLLAAPVFLFAVHALAWGLTMSPENRRRLGWFRLTALQTFSFGLSGMLPMQVFISEPLKLAFVRDTNVDREDFAASLLIDNTLNGISIFLVAAGGMAYLALALVTDNGIRLLVLALTVACVIGFTVLILAQKRGLFTGVLNLLGRIRVLSGFRDRHVERTGRIDAHVRRFYAGNRANFFAVLFLHTLEKAQGVFEFWIIFHALGMDVSWGDCFFIFAVASTLDNLLFFAQVGGMEAWVSSTLSWMGLTRDGVHITAALFRRVRFLFWALVALLLIRPTRRLLLRERGGAAPVPESGWPDRDNAVPWLRPAGDLPPPTPRPDRGHLSARGE